MAKGKPLQGVRVLDLTRVLAGPFCAAQLGDLGAEVIKVERPKYGDDSRFFGPYKNGESSYYMLMNRNKKGITLNFKSEKALKIFYELVRKSDVVVENFKPGVAAHLKIDYETLKEINPRLIYASISGFGQYGPYAPRPGYDIVAQAMGGLMSITGYPDAPPARVGSSIADVSAGLYAAAGIMAALYAREKTGKGSYVDVSLLDFVFAFCETNIVRYTIGGVIPKRVGARHPLSAPFDIYRAKDGYVVIAVANERIMDRLWALMGRMDLKEDPRFKTDADRSKNDVALKVIIEDWLKDTTVAEAVAAMLEKSIPASPLQTIPQACADEQIAARHMLVTIDHPRAGKVQITGNPMKFAGVPDNDYKPSPELGADNEAVLGELCGCSPEEVRAMEEAGDL